MNSPLAKIFNPNTLKVSYSCMGNMVDVVRSHNRKLSRDEKLTSMDLKCNCRNKDNCPLRGNCQVECVIFKATVEPETGPTRTYIGLSESPLKRRYSNHMTTFRHDRY